jgi:hypothetical protein
LRFIFFAGDSQLSALVCEIEMHNSEGSRQTMVECAMLSRVLRCRVPYDGEEPH